MSIARPEVGYGAAELIGVGFAVVAGPVETGNPVLKVAGGAPVTVTVAVPQSQGASPVELLAAPPVGGGTLIPEAKGACEPVPEAAASMGTLF